MDTSSSSIALSFVSVSARTVAHAIAGRHEAFYGNAVSDYSTVSTLGLAVSSRLSWLTELETVSVASTSATATSESGLSWEIACERFKAFKSKRCKHGSLVHLVSRLGIAERIFNGYRVDHDLPEGFSVREVMTLDMLEYLQERLLDGDECRYETRSPNSVNSMMCTVMTFVRFCCKREWIDRVPDIERLEVAEVMKGRPISAEEFERMLKVTPQVVGESVAESWKFALRVLWLTGFRVADLLDFSWDDDRHIRPSGRRAGACCHRSLSPLHRRMVALKRSRCWRNWMNYCHPFQSHRGKAGSLTRAG